TRMDARLPAHIEITGLIRSAEAQGGMATVLSKGERDAGTILVVTMYRGENATLYERMPQLDGSRTFEVTKTQDIEKPFEFGEYLTRRGSQDPDCWILEVDVVDPERFVADNLR
ncbi:MAG: DUF1491 family protein, partial [Pseudomonadota bacterium]